MLLTFSQIVGPTVAGKKKFLQLDRKDKLKILKQIESDWKNLINLHFLAQGAINKNDQVREWEELSQDYYERKVREGYLPGILERSTPTLSERYQDAISYDPNNFTIKIDYPILMGNGYSKSQTVDAEVHQEGLGVPQRPLTKLSFKRLAQKRVLDYLTRRD